MKRNYNLLFLLIVMLLIFIGIGDVKADSTVIYSDGTLIINEKDSSRETNMEKHGTVSHEFAALSESNPYHFTALIDPVWFDYSDDIKALEIGQEIHPTSTAYWFKSMENLQKMDLSNLDTSNVTNMEDMFGYTGQSSTIWDIESLSKFDTSNVISMQGMFTEIKGKNLMFDFSKWNVSKVTNMEAMFAETENLTINIFNWDTSSVTDMSNMFRSVDNVYLLGDLIVPDNCELNEFSLKNKSSKFTYALLIKGRIKGYIGDFTGLLMYDNEVGKNTIGFYAVEYKPLRKIVSNTNNVEVNGKKVEYLYARSGDAVKLFSNNGYMVKSVSVTKKSTGEKVDYDYSKDTFVMPDDDIDINVKYMEIPEIGNVVLNKPSLVNYKDIKITWDATENADGYVVSLVDGKTFKTILEEKTTNLYYKLDNLEEYYNYYVIFVYAYKDIDVDGYTKTIKSYRKGSSNLRTSKELAAPTVVSKLTNYDKILLSWNSVEGARGYNIYYKEKGSDEYKFLNATRNLYYEKTFSTKKEYDFKIVPVTHFVDVLDKTDSSGYDSEFVFESRLFGVTNIKTKALPSVGSLSISSSLPNNVKISWLGDDYADFYKIYYKEYSKSNYEYLGRTTNKHYVVTNLLPAKMYTFKIVPCLSFDDNEVEGNTTWYTYETSKYTITASKISGITDKVYNGQKRYQSIKVTYQGRTLVNGRDYTVSYKNNVNTGKASVIITGKGDYTGSTTRNFKIYKASNPMAVITNKKTVKYSKLRRKKQVVANTITVKKSKGKVTYSKASKSSRLILNKTTGKITVKKGTKRGTYKLKVKVSAAGNSNYKSRYKIVTVTIRVK
mgnify:CR=1 FL=1